MESGKKWYMIRHNRCSAVFAIDQVAFYNSFVSDSSEREKKVICPNCGEIAMNLDKVESLLRIFEENVKLSKHITITELKEEDLENELTTKIIRGLKGS